MTRCKKDCSSFFFFTTLATFTKFYSDGHHWSFGWVLFYAENLAFGKIVFKIMATPEQEFDQALQFAEEVREKVLAFLEGISQSESESKPGPEVWSISEIAHHLLLSERRLSQQILESIAHSREGEFNREEVLAERPFPLEDTADTGKSGKGTAPEPTQPSPGLPIADLLLDLRQARDETRAKLLPLRSRPLGNLWWEHPRFGAMNLYERIRMSGYHDLKHLKQLENCLARNADQAK